MFIKEVASFGYQQIRNIKNLILAHPLATPPLVSATLDSDDVDIAKRLLKNGKNWFDQIILKEYENSFAEWNGSKYAFSFMGGRVALSACIYALNLRPNDEVILPGYTCVVVANAFQYAGIKTIYSDIELDTFGLDASHIEAKITPKTRAILLHHLYGLVCRDYDRIIQIARKNGLYIIEDCAQSAGAEYRNIKVGNYGDVAIYSTEQSKIFNTIQGGMATTNDSYLAKKIKEYYDQAPYPDAELIDKQLRSLIMNYYTCKDPQRYWKGELVRFFYKNRIITTTTKEEEQGIKPIYYGRRMPGAIAEIGLNQLKKVNSYNHKRRQTAKIWDNWCDKRGYKKPIAIRNSIPVYLRYPVIVEPDKKRQTAWAYKELGVTLGVWFVSNIHPANRTVDGCPNADIAVTQCVNFPCLNDK